MLAGFISEWSKSCRACPVGATWGASPRPARRDRWPGDSARDLPVGLQEGKLAAATKLDEVGKRAQECECEGCYWTLQVGRQGSTAARTCTVVSARGSALTRVRVPCSRGRPCQSKMARTREALKLPRGSSISRPCEVDDLVSETGHHNEKKGESKQATAKSEIDSQSRAAHERG